MDLFRCSNTVLKLFLLVHACLCSHLCREIINLLLDSLTGLETDKLPDLDLRTVLLGDSLEILLHCLLSVLSLYINLLEQTYFLELLVETSGFPAIFGSFLICSAMISFS